MKLTWRQKNKILLVGSLLFAILIYQQAIRKTIELRNHVARQSDNVVSGQQLQEEWTKLQAVSRQLDGVLQATGKDVQLLVYQWAEASGSRVVRIPVPLRQEEQGISLLYQDYGLEGRFAELLRALHYLERDDEVNLVHASFRKELDSQTRQPQLRLHIITLNIEPDEK